MKRGRASGSVEETGMHYVNMRFQYAAIFKGCKNDNFKMKLMIFFLISLKTYIVNTCKKQLFEAVLWSTHDICFITKIRKLMPYPCKPQFFYMSLVMRKPAFCICENKDADQLRGNREADQLLCFRYTDSTIPLLPKYEISSLQPSSVAV